MTSLILQAASRLLQPVILLVAAFLLFRGHDRPGGGFVGGLVAAAGFALHSLAFGVRAARESLRIDPGALTALGLALAVLVAAGPMVRGRPLLAASWIRIEVPGIALDLGTPLAFDVAVFLIVVGATLTILIGLEEE